MEPVGLRDEDDRGPERAAELADEPQLDAEPADGEPESNPVRGPDDSTQCRWSWSYRASQQSNVFDLCGETLVIIYPYKPLHLIVLTVPPLEDKHGYPTTT